MCVEAGRQALCNTRCMCAPTSNCFLQVLRHLYQKRLQECFLFKNTKPRFMDAVLAVGRMELIMPNVSAITHHA